MATIYGNEITFKTFNYLKVNEKEIRLPDLQKQPYPLPSMPRVWVAEFEEKRYGASQEAIAINETYGNLYRYYEVKENEEKNLDLLKLTTDDQHPSLLDTHDIVVGASGKLRLVLDYHAAGSKDKFRNSLIRVLAKPKAEVKIFILQRELEQSLSLESIFVHTQEEAHVEIYQYHLGAKQLCTNYQADIMGERSSVKVDSIYYAYQEHDLDLLYNIFHHGKETKSDILVNGVMKDRSRKIFKSNLDFKEGCTKSEGSEEEYVLMLDDTTTNIAVPILLCHEDDVQGNHAASAGKVDQETMFYLMSRGLDEKQAESIIIESKFSPTIDALESPELQREVWEFIRKITKGDMHG